MGSESQMKIEIRLTPRAGEDRILGWSDELRAQLMVRVKAAPADGKANAALIGLLAESLGVAKSRIRLLRGGRSRDKLLGIDCDAKTFQEWTKAVPVIRKE